MMPRSNAVCICGTVFPTRRKPTKITTSLTDRLEPGTLKCMERNPGRLAQPVMSRDATHEKTLYVYKYIFMQNKDDVFKVAGHVYISI